MAERYNSGGAFRNDRKTKPTQAGYTGTMNVEGVLYFVDVWVKDSSKNPGEKFLSFSLKRKDKQEGAISAAPVLFVEDDVPL
jgi:hypothetical protein